MSFNKFAIQSLLFGLGSVAFPSVSSAVITFQDPGRNLSAPTGSLVDSGWNFQADYGGHLGTAIGPRHFLSAAHVGGGAGTSFGYRGAAYSVVRAQTIAGTDLRVYEVAGTFNSWAPLWNPAVDGSEVGRDLVVFGKGWTRGRAVASPIFSGRDGTSPDISQTAAGDLSTLSTGIVASRVPPGSPDPTTPSDHIGWEWESLDRLRSWGQNTVDSVITDPTYGQLLTFDFDGPGIAGPNESMLAGGDSGGAVFARNSAGVWKLAGINLGIDGPFSYTRNGEGFFAALFDAGGLWVGTPGQRGFIPDSLSPQPISSYSTRAGGYLNEINAFINAPGVNVPEPTFFAWTSLGLTFMLKRKTRI